MFDGLFEMFNEEKKEDEDTEVTYPSTAPASVPSNVFVLSIGGSVLINGKPDKEAIAGLSECLNELIRGGLKFVLVIGGGKVARDYVNAARQLGANNFELDELGIRITRANASLMLSTIENAFPEILTDVTQAKDVLRKGQTPIYGGLFPGFTTDTVAALLAEYLNATFINLSNIDGIFTADPAAYPSARLYHELSYDKLLQLLLSNKMKPSQNIILDLPAAMILKRSSITAFFLNGHDLENFKAAVQGAGFRGSTVNPESQDTIEEEPVPKPRGATRKTAKKRKKPKSSSEEEEINPEEIQF